MSLKDLSIDNLSYHHKCQIALGKSLVHFPKNVVQLVEKQLLKNYRGKIRIPITLADEKNIKGGTFSLMHVLPITPDNTGDVLLYFDKYGKYIKKLEFHFQEPVPEKTIMEIIKRCPNLEYVEQCISIDPETVDIYSILGNLRRQACLIHKTNIGWMYRNAYIGIDGKFFQENKINNKKIGVSRGGVVACGEGRFIHLV